MVGYDIFGRPCVITESGRINSSTRIKTYIFDSEGAANVWLQRKVQEKCRQRGYINAYGRGWLVDPHELVLLQDKNLLKRKRYIKNDDDKTDPGYQGDLFRSNLNSCSMNVVNFNQVREEKLEKARESVLVAELLVDSKANLSLAFMLSGVGVTNFGQFMSLSNAQVSDVCDLTLQEATHLRRMLAERVASFVTAASLQELSY